MAETILNVQGMTCGHCVKTVERAALSVPGTRRARAELASGRLTVEGDASPADVAAAVREAGYEA